MRPHAQGLLARALQGLIGVMTPASLARLALCAIVLAGTPCLAAHKHVAVLYFDNDTKDPELDLLRKGMADMLITDLSDIDGITVVEREKLEAVLGELKLQRSKYFDPKTAVKLGRGIGATHAVTGAFNAVGQQLRIDVRLIEIASGKVVIASKARGKKADFFDLQQQLALTFGCALAEARCGASPAQGGPDLETVRRFARGLEQADAGQLKQASKTLQSVVTAAPNFGSAKASYRRVMKRLYSARAKRTGALSKARATLEAHVEQALKREAKDGRSVGYRVLAGQLILHQLDADLRAAAQRGAKLEGAVIEDLEGHMKAYLQNQERLLTWLEKMPVTLPDCELSEADTALGTKLGLGDEPGVLSFYSAIQVRRDLGTFLTTGAAPFWGTFRFSKDIALYTPHRVDSGVRNNGVIEYRDVRRPPVERLHTKFAPTALGHFEAALAAAEKLPDAEDRQTEIIRTLEAFANGLVALKRPMEAIARWQAILERYPKYEEYDRIEGLVRATLGE